MAPAIAPRLPPSDFDLIARTLAGDQESFAEIVRKYQDRLFNTIVRIVGCHFEAEDILQNTLLQAYLKLSHFRGHSTLYTWLYRLAVNQTLTRLRQKKNILSLECASTRTSRELQDPAELPAERLERLEDCARIRDILAQLDEEHRVVLVLREMDQLDYAAIASILAINLGTVRSRLHRARSRLRELLSA